MNRLVAILITTMVRGGSYIGHCHIDLESLLCESCIFGISSPFFVNNDNINNCH